MPPIRILVNSSYPILERLVVYPRRRLLSAEAEKKLQLPSGLRKSAVA